MRIIRIIINPSLQVGKNILQILHAILAGFHRVITQVFLDSTRVITSLYLLATITINRVSRMFVHPLFHDRLLLPLVSRSGNILIIPFNQELVINTQIRGSQFHALIPGLRHVIETSVIHDTRCRSVFLSKRCRTQRINREGCRRSHVVHESQAMPYFVCHHVDQRGFHHVIRQFLASHGRIKLGGLHETPVVDQLDDITVNQHGGINNLTRRRVCPRRSHCISRGISHVTNTGIFQVIRVKIGIILREILREHHVFKTNFLKSGIPCSHRLTNRFFPQFRESVIHVEHNLFHGLHQLAPFVSLHVLRFQSPAMSHGIIPDFILLRDRKTGFRTVENPHAGI